PNLPKIRLAPVEDNLQRKTAPAVVRRGRRIAGPEGQPGRDQDRQGESMKRTAGAFTLLAALSGCMSTQPKPAVDEFGGVGRAREIPGLIGPGGVPVQQAADGTAAPVSGLTPVAFRGQSAGLTPAAKTDSAVKPVSFTSTSAIAAGASAGRATSFGPNKYNGQVPPPPRAGYPGAVAAVGAMPGGMPAMGNARSSVRFSGQD